MKFIVSTIFLLFLLGCNENSQKTNANYDGGKIKQESISSQRDIEKTTLIIPGEKLGTIILEKNSASVFDSLGKPDASDAAMGKAISTWKKGENLLTMYTTTQMGVENFSRIKAIRSLSNDFKTEDNMGVSSSIDALKRYYRLDPVGKFTFNGKHYFLYSTSKGIAFEIGMNQICNGILLYSQDTDPENYYLAMYPDFKKL